MNNFILYLMINLGPFVPMACLVGIFVVVLHQALDLDLDLITDQVTAQLSKTTNFLLALTTAGTIVMLMLVVIPSCVLTVQYLTAQ